MEKKKTKRKERSDAGKKRFVDYSPTHPLPTKEK
jgi:hypothetical protein